MTDQKRQNPRTPDSIAGPDQTHGITEHHTPNKRLLTAQQAAAYLNIGKRTLWTLQNCGELAHVRIGARAVRFLIDDLDGYIAKERKGGGR